MSVSAAIQKMLRDRLIADSAVAALVGARVYARPPADAVFPFVSFGPTDFVPTIGGCVPARDEFVQIDVWSNYQGGHLEAKRIVDAIKASLHEFEGTLEVGALIDCRVASTRVFSDPDPTVSHGVVTVEVQAEEI